MLLGLLFLNPFVILAAAVLLGYLGFRAVQFRRFCTAIADRLEVRLHPLNLTGLVAIPFKLHAAIHNSYHLPARLSAFRLKILDQITGEAKVDNLTIEPGSAIDLTVSMRANFPGQFKIANAIITLNEGSGLLSHKLRLKCAALIEVTPVVDVGAALQLGSMADVSRPGTGPDLAGIREAVSEDDFRSIDWKSTARTGRFMIKQYYQETELTVIFAIDKSALARGGRSEGHLLLQLGRLVVAFGYSTPVGAVLFEGRGIVGYVAPSVGAHSIQRVLRLLLRATTTTVTEGARATNESFTLVYNELVDLIGTLRATSRSQPVGRIDAFAKITLPYYENLERNYPSELLGQGAFQALESISYLPPSLVIVVSTFNTDLRGICEGAISAHASGHRVIAVVVGSVRDVLPTEVLALRELGIQVLQTSGADMLDAIRKAVITVPVIRVRSLSQQRTTGHRLGEHLFPHLNVP